MGTTNICRVCGARTDERSCPQCGATTVRSNLTAYLAGQPTGMTASGGDDAAGGAARLAPDDLARTARGMLAAGGIPMTSPLDGATRPRPPSLTTHLRILLYVPIALFVLIALNVMLEFPESVRSLKWLLIVLPFIALSGVYAAVLWPLFRGFGWTRLTYIWVTWMGVVGPVLRIASTGADNVSVGRLCAALASSIYVQWFLTRPEAVAWYDRNCRH